MGASNGDAHRPRVSASRWSFSSKLLLVPLGVGALAASTLASAGRARSTQAKVSGENPPSPAAARFE